MVLTAQNGVYIEQQNSELKDRIKIALKDTTYNVMYLECCLIYFVFVQSKVLVSLIMTLQSKCYTS
jgi:hypothetical protein